MSVFSLIDAGSFFKNLHRFIPGWQSQQAQQSTYKADVLVPMYTDVLSLALWNVHTRFRDRCALHEA